jgi:hypothetical protein
MTMGKASSRGIETNNRRTTFYQESYTVTNRGVKGRNAFKSEQVSIAGIVYKMDDVRV